MSKQFTDCWKMPTFERGLAKLAFASWLLTSLPASIAEVQLGGGFVLVSTEVPEPTALALQSDGKLLANVRQSEDISQYKLFRFHSDGSADTQFKPERSGSVFALQSDGRILVGGIIYNDSGPRSFLSRIDSNGTVDGEFNPQLEGMSYEPYKHWPIPFACY